MMYSTNDPVGDAERFFDVTPAQAAREEAEQRIRDAFKAYFGGELGAEAPITKFVLGSTYLLEATEPVATSIADALSIDSECEDALQALLTGTGTVERLRSALVEQHIERWASELADLLIQQSEEACCE